MKEESTKEKILAAARKLFVAHGFAGASIGKIAKLAQVNHSLIFHHFNNKEQLWTAVKQDVVQEASIQTKTLPDINPSFEIFLKELFVENIRFYRSNPDIIRMINWQRLEHNSELKIGITLSSEMQNWLKAFKYYQQKGDINSELKLEFIITLILSMISSAALDPNVFISSKRHQKEYIEFCVQHLQKALK
jgi:AcrR family transcriptional regulator